MKTIKVLIAAHDELHEEKIQFSSLIESLNESLSARGIELERVKWDPDIDGSVDDFIEELRDCEMCLTLYWRELADNAAEELTTAYQSLKEGGNPRNLYVFFKEPAEGMSDALRDFKTSFVTNYGHFFCKFENVDTMNLHFILQLEAYQNNLQSEQDKFITVSGGKVKVGNRDMVNLDNVPFAAFNNEYRRLQQELADLDAQSAEARIRWKANPDDENLEDEYFALRSRRKKVSDEFEQYQTHLYDIALGFARRAGEKLSERMHRAKEEFEKGNVIEADRILNMEEMKREADKEMKQFEHYCRNLELKVEEFRMKADTVMSNTELSVPERLETACEAFQEAISIAKRIHYDEAKLAEILFAYGYLLSEFNRIYEALSIYVEALDIYRKLSEFFNSEVFLYDLAGSLNNLAILQSNLRRYDDAERNYVESLSILLKLAESTPDVYLPAIAALLNNLAVMQRDINRYDDAERNFTEALSIRRKLAEFFTLEAYTLESYLYDLASTLNGLASLQSDLHRYDESEKNNVEALAIYRKLAESNPDTYLPYLAGSLNNLALLQRVLNRYNEAEINYKESLSIRRKLSESNPDAYLPDLAQSLNNLALLQSDLNRYEKAERDYSEALTIYSKLVAENPEAYQFDMAKTLEDIAILKKTQGKTNEAIEFYLEALAIYEKQETDYHGTYTDKIQSIRAELAKLKTK